MGRDISGEWLYEADGHGMLERREEVGMLPWKSFDFQTSGDAIYCIARVKMKLQ